MKFMLVLLVSIVSGCFLGVWMARRTPAPEPRVVFLDVATPQASSGATDRAARSQQLEAPQRVPVELAAPPDAQAASETGRSSAAEAWETLQASVRDLPDTCDGTRASAVRKYAGMNPAQLKLAFKTLEPRFEAETQRLLDEEMRKAAFEPAPQGDQNQRLSTTNSADHTSAMKFEQRLEGGMLHSREVRLDLGMHPDYQRLNVEYTWLRGELARLGW